jgi:hypothetical protein
MKHHEVHFHPTQSPLGLTGVSEPPSSSSRHRGLGCPGWRFSFSLSPHNARRDSCCVHRRYIVSSVFASWPCFFRARLTEVRRCLGSPSPSRLSPCGFLQGEARFVFWPVLGSPSPSPVFPVSIAIAISIPIFPSIARAPSPSPAFLSKLALHLRSFVSSPHPHHRRGP